MQWPHHFEGHCVNNILFTQIYFHYHSPLITFTVCDFLGNIFQLFMVFDIKTIKFVSLRILKPIAAAKN